MPKNRSRDEEVTERHPPRRETVSPCRRDYLASGSGLIWILMTFGR